MGRVSSGVRAPTGPCWHGGRRQHGLARARLHFESGLGLCTPRRPCMRPRVPRAKARDRPAGYRPGAWSCVTGGRAAGRDAHAKLRPGEAEAGAAPCDRLRRAVGRRSTQCPARRRRARRCIEAVLGSNLARVQAGSDEELHGAISRRSQPAARGMRRGWRPCAREQQCGPTDGADSPWRARARGSFASG